MTVKGNALFSQSSLECLLEMEKALLISSPSALSTVPVLCVENTKSSEGIFVITVLRAETRRPLCLISTLIFHFRACCTISNTPLTYTHTHTYTLKRLNLHGRGGFVAGANLVSASIKCYIGVLS